MRAVTVAVVLGVCAGLALPAAAGAVGSRPITLYFGLKRPEARARSAFFAVQQPGSRSYRRFLSARADVRAFRQPHRSGHRPGTGGSAGSAYPLVLGIIGRCSTELTRARLRTPALDPRPYWPPNLSESRLTRTVRELWPVIGGAVRPAASGRKIEREEFLGSADAP